MLLKGMKLCWLGWHKWVMVRRKVDGKVAGWVCDHCAKVKYPIGPE